MSVRPEQLVEAFAADVSVMRVLGLRLAVQIGQEGSEPACRCYRCGVLLTARDVQADLGRGGVRPVCESCRELRVTGG